MVHNHDPYLYEKEDVWPDPLIALSISASLSTYFCSEGAFIAQASHRSCWPCSSWNLIGKICLHRHHSHETGPQSSKAQNMGWDGSGGRRKGWCFLPRVWSYGFPKTTPIYNPFFPPLHNSCLNAIQERISGELCACSWRLSRHTALAAASSFCWPTLTSTSALLAPWDLQMWTEQSNLSLATSLTPEIQSHEYVWRRRVAWLHGERTSLWWH